MPNNTLYIYMLVDPRNGLPFYVGRTIDPKIRYSKHIGDARSFMNGLSPNVNKAKCQIIEDLIINNMRPSMIILDSCQIHNSMQHKFNVMDSLESYWAIKVERDNNCKLVGLHAGHTSQPILIGLGIQRSKYHIGTGYRTQSQLISERFSERLDEINSRIKQNEKALEVWEMLGLVDFGE